MYSFLDSFPFEVIREAISSKNLRHNFIRHLRKSISRVSRVDCISLYNFPTWVEGRTSNYC